MITALIFHLVSAWFAFLLPSFATYKALSRRDIDAVQNLSMYWCTVGVLVGIEHVCEWLICWFPFYWEVKTLFLLFLALPQTQGSTWVYQSYLEPFFRQNEHDLDQGILSTQSTAVILVQSKFQAVWEALWGMINRNAADGRPGVGAQGQQRPGGSQPGAASSPYDAARQLFNDYAPGVLGSFVNRAYGAAPTDANSNTRPSPRAAASSSTSFGGSENSSPYQRTPSHTPRNEGDAPNFPQPRFH
ncbi:TB2/DP1, HVA22 family-domain-containing protein [Thelephora terrestris]|uniref:Protein YOP1 n=1 Tax=Thelephora terrestris TaxID=56493 RepID=A0A9P6HH12_9AGAM|nr:TB2/DP1, HVA22 family-domain-containing protein [Thelephora terrestris]